MKNYLKNYLTIHDVYYADPTTMVFISSPRRKDTSVEGKERYLLAYGVLNGNVKFDVKSEWINAMTQVPSMDILSSVDFAAQMLTGHTLNQAWMSRKIFSKTEPLTFTIPVKFYFKDNASKDVIKPINDVIQMMILRKSFSFQNLANSALTSLIKSAKDASVNSNSLEQVYDFLNKNEKARDLLSSIIVYKIPGPHPFASTQVDDGVESLAGDIVSVRVGNIIDYKICYLTNFSGTFSSSLDEDGNPLFAECEITFSALDALVLDDYNTSSNFSAFKVSYQKKTTLESLTNIMKALLDTALKKS